MTKHLTTDGDLNVADGKRALPKASVSISDGQRGLPDAQDLRAGPAVYSSVQMGIPRTTRRTILNRVILRAMPLTRLSRECHACQQGSYAGCDLYRANRKMTTTSDNPHTSTELVCLVPFPFRLLDERAGALDMLLFVAVILLPRREQFDVLISKPRDIS